MIIDFHIFSTPMTLTLLTILILERLLKNINKSYVRNNKHVLFYCLDESCNEILRCVN